MTPKQKLLSLAERLVPRAADSRPQAPRRFLLWSITHLGDVVLQLPAAAALKRRFPEAQVVMVVKSAFRPLVEISPHVDRILCYDPRWSTRPTQPRTGLRETARLRGALRAFDVAFIFDFHPLSRLLLRSAAIPALVGYGSRSSCLSVALPGPQPGQHRLEEGLALLEAVGVPTASATPELSIPESVRGQAKDLLRQEGWQGEPLVGICPGAGNPQKCWPPERFAAAANHLRGDPQNVLLLGAVHDRDPGARLQAALRRRALNLVGRTDARELAALLSLCELILTNDSGAMHLAAALGKPLVALFGPTDARKWAPRGPGKQVLAQAPSRRMEDLTAEEVVRLINQHWPALGKSCGHPSQ